MIVHPELTTKGGADASPPRGWGADALTDFLEAAHRNRWATFANKPDWFGRLIRIDNCFMTVMKDWTNPKNVLAPLFVCRTHAAFRATVEHASAGQVAEVFPLARACLEFAVYGLHIARNPSLGDVWQARHDDAASMATVKREFTIANVKATLQKAEQHTAQVFNTLYQRAIDFGGHPNERSISGNLKIEEKAHHVEYKQVYLHPDGNVLDFALKTAAQTGVCVLEICQLIFPARFELLGARQEILELREGF